ncbi:MAG: AraC family transcriptional regulator ligand-binding domain-containing protein [Alcanivorax sp.]|nr:AraC family transcriptional regulator ligand-binding domain-containing protein [Alcanivorax sp.]
MQREFAVPTATIAIANVLCRIVHKRGENWQGLLQECGLEEQQLHEPDLRLPLPQLADLFAAAVAQTRDPSLGRQAGRAIQPNDLHALGVVMQFSATLEQACQTLADHFDWLIEGLILGVQRQEQTLTLRLNTHSLHLSRSPLLDFLMAALDQLLCQLCPAPLVAIEPASSNAQGTPRSARELRYPLAPLQLAMPQADAGICHHTLQLLEQFRGRRHAHALVMKVRLSMEKLLSEQALNEERLAEEMGMSIRTLQRRLRQCGTSYSRLLTQVRQSLSVSLLRDSRIPIEDLASQLGFTEAANFSRAFRRWYNTTPSAYRQQLGLQPPLR